MRLVKASSSSLAAAAAAADTPPDNRLVTSKAAVHLYASKKNNKYCLRKISSQIG